MKKPSSNRRKKPKRDKRDSVFTKAKFTKSHYETITLLLGFTVMMADPETGKDVILALKAMRRLKGIARWK